MDWIDYIRYDKCENFGMTKDCYNFIRDVHDNRNLLQDVYYHEQLLLMPHINQYPKPVIMTLAKLAVHDYTHLYVEILHDLPVSMAKRLMEKYDQNHPGKTKLLFKKTFANAVKPIYIPTKMSTEDREDLVSATLSLIANNEATMSDVEEDPEQLKPEQIEALTGFPELERWGLQQDRRKRQIQGDWRRRDDLNWKKPYNYKKNFNNDEKSEFYNKNRMMKAKRKWNKTKESKRPYQRYNKLSNQCAVASFSKTEADRLDGVGLLPWRFRNNPRYELVEDEDVFRVVKKTPRQGKLDAIREKYTVTKQEVQLEQIERHQTFQDDKLDKLFGKLQESQDKMMEEMTELEGKLSTFQTDVNSIEKDLSAITNTVSKLDIQGSSETSEQCYDRLQTRCDEIDELLWKTIPAALAKEISKGKWISLANRLIYLMKMDKPSDKSREPNSSESLKQGAICVVNTMKRLFFRHNLLKDNLEDVVNFNVFTSTILEYIGKEQITIEQCCKFIQQVLFCQHCGRGSLLCGLREKHELELLTGLLAQNFMQNWLHGYPCYCENNDLVFCKHSCKHQFLETGLFASMDTEKLNHLSNYLSEVETQTCPCEHHLDDYSNEHYMQSPFFVTYRVFTRRYKAVFRKLDIENMNKQYSETLEAWIYAKLYGYMNPAFEPIMFSESVARNIDENTFGESEQEYLLDSINSSCLVPNLSLTYGRLELLKKNSCPCNYHLQERLDFFRKSLSLVPEVVNPRFMAVFLTMPRTNISITVDSCFQNLDGNFNHCFVHHYKLQYDFNGSSAMTYEKSDDPDKPRRKTRLIIQAYRKDDGDFCINFVHDETDSPAYFNQDEQKKILTEMAEAGTESCEEIEESIPDSLPDLIEVASIRSTDDEQGATQDDSSNRPSCIAEKAEQRSLFGPEGFEGQLDLKRSYLEIQLGNKSTIEDLD